MKGGLSLGILVLMSFVGLFEIWVDHYYIGGGIWLLGSISIFPPLHERVFGRSLWPAPISLGIFVGSFLAGFLCMAAGL